MATGRGSARGAFIDEWSDAAPHHALEPYVDPNWDD